MLFMSRLTATPEPWTCFAQSGAEQESKAHAEEVTSLPPAHQEAIIQGDLVDFPAEVQDAVKKQLNPLTSPTAKHTGSLKNQGAKNDDAGNDKILLNGKLTPEERKNLRENPLWETCLRSWLDSARPSMIWEKLALPKEEFCQWMDRKVLDLMLLAVDESDEIETLQELFPMWEEQISDLPAEEYDDELVREAALELTPEERKQVLQNHLPQ
jgi:hypothetical protein